MEKIEKSKNINQKVKILSYFGLLGNSEGALKDPPIIAIIKNLIFLQCSPSGALLL